MAPASSGSRDVTLFAAKARKKGKTRRFRHLVDITSPAIADVPCADRRFAVLGFPCGSASQGDPRSALPLDEQRSSIRGIHVAAASFRASDSTSMPTCRDGSSNAD